jgi:hypothetical protein
MRGEHLVYEVLGVRGGGETRGLRPGRVDGQSDTGPKDKQAGLQDR